MSLRPRESVTREAVGATAALEIHRARVVEKMAAHSLSELIQASRTAGMQPRG